MPESLVSISHLPVYSELSSEFKLLFNQYNALGVAELFIFFEETSLAPSMEDALLRAKTESLKLALKNFIEEEYKHSEIFKKLLKSAAPNLYNGETIIYNFVKLSLISKLLFNTLRKFPQFLPAWVWGALFFEERTLLYSKEYTKQFKQVDKNIDELFYQAHYYHMLDEVRHVKLDEHMIENFYTTYGKYHARFVAWMSRRIIQRSAYPINMIKACIKQIKKTRPMLISIEIENRILSEAKKLPQTKSFVDLNFGESAAPRTRFLMSQFAEFNNFWQKILTVK
jgi:rubrerythrin